MSLNQKCPRVLVDLWRTPVKPRLNQGGDEAVGAGDAALIPIVGIRVRESTQKLGEEESQAHNIE